VKVVSFKDLMYSFCELVLERCFIELDVQYVNGVCVCVCFKCMFQMWQSTKINRI